MMSIKSLFILIMFALLIQACSSNQTYLELTPEQSMLIIGKGPGQDAAINPYQGEKSIALVKNLEGARFNVRIQRQGSIIDQIEVRLHETKEFILEAEDELYLDTEVNAKARVSFKRL